MKNMKIKAKLIMGFAIVAAIAAFIGAMGTVMLLRNDASYSNILVSNNETLMSLADLRENYQMERVYLRNVVIAVPDGAEAVNNAISNFTTSSQLVSASFAEYEKTIEDKNREAAFYTARDTYEGAFTVAVNKLLAAAKAGDYNAASAELVNTASAAAPIASGLSEIVKVNDQISNENAAALKNSSMITAITMVAIAIVSVLLSIILGLYIAKIIGTPTKAICDTLNIIGQTGSLTFPADIVSITEETSRYNDELGQSASALNGLTKRLTYISEQLDLVADGDLTSDIKLASDSDVMGLSLKKMSDGLNSMFAEINSSTNQVSTGSTQIADGAQMLAQGATEQSATVEELSASIAEISEQTKQNAGLANDARELGEDIKHNAEKGNGQMEQMIKAVGEISDASQSIGKVIKIIDDIAFQTNILALNAAVEAARAGQHGKGFAVVADEVRSLAAKSAEAAKNTSELIATSIQKSEMGAAISQETAESLKQIVEGILKSSALVANIATSSNQQATAISQVSEGIEQVSQVVQQNSATAEESAAASEQMSGQATLLQQLISQFKLKNSAHSAQSFTAPAKSVASVRMPVETGFAMSGDSKY